MRVFAALCLPADIVAILREAAGELKRRYPRLNTVRAEGLHLTLVFFGELSETRAGQIAALMDRPELARPPIAACLGRIGQFPPRGNPRVIFCALERGGDEVTEHYNRFCRLLRELDPVLLQEEKGFHPHITLARNKTERVLQETLASLTVRPEGFLIDRFVLYQSILKPAGAEHKPLHTVMFR